MRTKLIAAATAFLSLTSIAPAAANPALDTLFAQYQAYRIQANPIEAGNLGVQEALSRLPDVSPGGQITQEAALTRLQQLAGAIPAAGLTPDEALNLRLLGLRLAEERASIRFDEVAMPFLNDSGFHTVFDYLAQGSPIRNAKDSQAWLARLSGFSAYYSRNISNARRGIKLGFVQPKLVVERVLAVARLQAARDPDKDVLLESLRQSPLAPAEKAAALEAAERLVRGPIHDARQSFVTFLENEYLPKAKATLAAKDWPGGSAYYRWLVRRYTTTELTPDAIHALGLSEVARIRMRMEEVMATSGFKGSFAQFLAFLRSDKQFYAQSRESLLEHAAEISKRADGQLPGLFGRLPRLSYGVRAVPLEVEDGYTTGRYQEGSPSLGVAGFYLVNTGNLPARPLYELPALTLHEAVPGHHLQIALAQELEELPWHRRTADFTAFVEGWGLYSEYLGEEMGMYRTPYEVFGRLSYEMWRACRLVADTGIHWKGWSLEQAGRCFRENSALSEHNIKTELERYVAWPGQALGYKIGEIRLRELRAKAQDMLGAKFEVRRFHDAVLLAGPLPLDVLSARVDAWINAEQTR